MVGGCDRVENYSQRSVGARNTKAQQLRVYGAPDTLPQYSDSERTPSEPAIVENAPLC